MQHIVQDTIDTYLSALCAENRKILAGIKIIACIFIINYIVQSPDI